VDLQQNLFVKDKDFKSSAIQQLLVKEDELIVKFVGNNKYYHYNYNSITNTKILEDISDLLAKEKSIGQYFNYMLKQTKQIVIKD
jgi:hypothetical protein